jgi:hypothetical protein
LTARARAPQANWANLVERVTVPEFLPSNLSAGARVALYQTIASTNPRAIQMASSRDVADAVLAGMADSDLRVRA